MPKEMIINTVENKECRIAILDNRVLEELYIERVSSASRVGNIYKGRVSNVEAAIQAAFVDFGAAKDGFLHISDLHPQHFPRGAKDQEAVGRKRAHKDRPPIQDCLRRGQEVVVQMTKEGIGTKGPTMTTYLSIPGRLLVMMPGMSRLGVSRRIEDEEARDHLRKLLETIDLPQDVGFIVRTAGAERTKRDIQRDLSYLTRLWKRVNQRIKSARPPAEIYRESDLVRRTIRDVYNSDIGRIVCDREPVARQVKEFLDVAMPRGKHVIEVYTGRDGLFHDLGIEEEIEKVYSRRVELPSGGSIVIDQTEALVAIDVNSGRFREHSDAETTALQIDLQAAKEIARQLRLRDLGGVIIIDFIDMREDKNRRAVERALREAVKPGRAKTKILHISRLGIVEMTRQRVRPSLEAGSYRTCTGCGGTGSVKSEESLALAVMRNLQRATGNTGVAHIEVAVTPSVAHHLANFQRKQIGELESETGITIVVRADEGLSGSDAVITCLNSRGAPVAWEQQAPTAKGRAKLATINVDDLPPPEQEAEVPKEPSDQEDDRQAAPHVQEPAPEGKPRKRRPRRRSRKKAAQANQQRDPDAEAATKGAADKKVQQDAGPEQKPGRAADKNAKKEKGAPAAPDRQQQQQQGEKESADQETGAVKKTRRPRRRRKKKKAASAEVASQQPQ